MTKIATNSSLMSTIIQKALWSHICYIKHNTHTQYYQLEVAGFPFYEHNEWAE